MSILRSAVLLALPLALLGTPTSRAHSTTTPHIHAGERWETTLTSSRTYTNPYRHLLLRVTWTCVSGCLQGQADWFPKFGYWDGGNSFRVRAAFPQRSEGVPAVWAWSTSCETTSQGIAAGEPQCSAGQDAGLHRTGQVTVLESNTAVGITNRLYLGGRLAKSWQGATTEQGQLINGNIQLGNSLGPFYWLSDTAWPALVRSRLDRTTSPNCATSAGWSTNDWRCYVADRVAKGFTAIQVSVPQGWMASPLVDTAGHKPFDANASFPAWARWNPAFWRNFEDKIQWANEQGLVVFVVGLMEPSYQAWGATVPDSQRFPPLEDARTFARSLAARLAGNHVVFSPGFDTRPDAGDKSALIRAIGAEIHSVAPFALITNHFGGSTPVAVNDPVALYNDYRDFQSEPWLDLHLFQSGQCSNLPGGGNPATSEQQLDNLTNRARQMAIDLRALQPEKGLGNAETIYDQEDAAILPGLQAPPNRHLYVPYRVRHTAYLSTLSGAFGASLGVYGIWDWGLGSAPYVVRSPRIGAIQPSATQMQILANLMRANRSEWFLPVPGQIRNNPAAPLTQHLQMVASRDLTRRSTLVYLPDNPTLDLQLPATLYPSFATARWSKQFIDPRDPTRAPVPATFSLLDSTNAIFRFTPPVCVGRCNGQLGDLDWVLVLRDTSLSQAPWTLSSGLERPFQAWERFDAETSTWRIEGQLVEANGDPVGPLLSISEATSALQRLPQVARGSAGGFLIVWEAEDALSGETRVIARRLDGLGVPQGQVFSVGSQLGRQLDPVVTADGLGNFLVTWVNAEIGSDQVDILAQRFDKDGVALGTASRVSADTPGNRRSPLISADPAGNFVVAWQTWDPTSETWSLRAQRFSSATSAMGAEIVLEAGGAGEYLALERLEMDGLGNFQAIWHRLAAGASLGHYGRSFDRSVGLAPSVTLVMGPEL